MGRALNAARKLQFGTVWINDHIPLVSEMPHGGYKQSGYGKDFDLRARGLHPDQARDGEDRLGRLLATLTAEPKTAQASEEKGLKANAIGFVDALVIGLASTAPAYEAEVELAPSGRFRLSTWPSGRARG